MIHYLEILEQLRDFILFITRFHIYLHVLVFFKDGLQSEIGSLHCELEQKQSCITESGERLNKIMVWSISIHVLLKITYSSGSEKTK